MQETSKGRWRQAEAGRRQSKGRQRQSGKQQGAWKVCRRQAEAGKRQTEAFRLAVKRQKRQGDTDRGRHDAVKR